MSDPREWTDSDYQNFYERYDSPDDAANAGANIEVIIDYSNEGNYENTVDDIPQEPAA